MSEQETVRIIGPRGILGESEDDSPLETFLRKLADAVYSGTERGWDWPEKYGADFENDVFSMHRECQCYLRKEDDDCERCKANEPNFLHRPSEFSVYWYKYIGRSMKMNKEISLEELELIAASCFESIKKESKDQRGT